MKVEIEVDESEVMTMLDIMMEISKKVEWIEADSVDYRNATAKIRHADTGKYGVLAILDGEIEWHEGRLDYLFEEDETGETLSGYHSLYELLDPDSTFIWGEIDDGESVLVNVM